MKSSKMVFADNQKEDDTVSHYKHLSIEERESLYLGVNQGKSIRRIARELKRSASSLSRELSRNKISHRPYSPSRAQRRRRGVHIDLLRAAACKYLQSGRAERNAAQKCCKLIHIRILPVYISHE